MNVLILLRIAIKNFSIIILYLFIFLERIMILRKLVLLVSKLILYVVLFNYLMPMFNCVSKSLLYDFDSNPPLEDEFYTCPEQLPDGRVRNGISTRPVSNHSPLEGLHYDDLVFGLRAKLNAGVRLQEVPPINLHSDPTEILAQANTFVRNVSNKFNNLRELASAEIVDSVPNSSVEPSNS